MYHTLITGASSGIGKAMAIECAKRGMNVILVALDTPELYQTAEKIKQSYNVEVNYLGLDLTSPKAPEKVYQWSTRLGLKVNTLINNAGMGNSGLFESNELDQYLNIINLNNRAMVELTYFYIKDLKAQAKGYILNVSSMEATLPLPYKAVYTGSKSFIYAFTLALREELKGTGISATVLCPGSVLTNEDGYRRIQAHGNKGKLFKRLMITYPEIVAKRAIQGMIEGRQVIVPNKAPWAIVKFMKLMPTAIKMRILEKIFRVYR
jgi:short-subunit dehydrogenase